MKHRTGCAGKLTLLVATVFFPAPWSPGSDESAEPRPSVVTERVHVQLFQLNFLAVDKKGNPVLDLSPREVEIVDQGVAQEIAFLEPYGRAVAPRAIGRSRRSPATGAATNQDGQKLVPPRWIVLFFDSFTSDLGTRQPSIEAAKRYVQASLRPGDQVQVVSFDGELHVLQNFTNELPNLTGTLDLALGQTDRVIEDRNAELAQLVRNVEDCAKQRSSAMSCARHLGGAYEDERRREADALLTALTQVLRSLAPIPDSKMLVLFSNGFSREPWGDVYDVVQMVLGSSMAGLLDVDRDPRVERLWEALALAASQARTSIFSINAGGGAHGSPVSAERASHLDSRKNPFQVDAFGRAELNRQLALDELGKRTGGTGTRNPDVLEGLTKIVGLGDGLYTVGYYPNRPDPSSPHDVKLRLRRKGAKAIHPREVPEEPPLAPLRAEMSFRTDPCTAPSQRTVTIELRVDVSSLVFENVEGQWVNNFSLYLLLMDESGGRVLHRRYRFLNVTYPTEEYRGKQLQDPTIEQTLLVPCRDLLVQASLVDAVTGARASLEQVLSP